MQAIFLSELANVKKCVSSGNQWMSTMAAVLCYIPNSNIVYVVNEEVSNAESFSHGLRKKIMPFFSHHER
jgi:hypothetical protein